MVNSEPTVLMRSPGLERRSVFGPAGVNPFRCTAHDLREPNVKVKHSENVESNAVDMEGASGCSVRQLVGPNDGAPSFAMRQFEVEPGGHTPRHFHDYEHEVYVLEGNGEVYEDDVAHPLKQGDVILVQPNDVHQFKNTGDAPMKFLCLIPNSATSKNVTVVPECGVEKD